MDTASPTALPRRFDAAGSVTSASASLSVTAAVAPVAVSISTQPSAQVQLPGGSATFAVAASGTGPLTYQWLKNGSAIAGATGPVLLLNGVSGSDAASYSVTVSNALGSLTSSAASLTVAGTLAITTAPAATSGVAVNTATGALANLGTPVATGSGPQGLALNTAGTRLYVANGGGNTVSAYSLNPAGDTLTALAGATATGGSLPSGIAVSP